MLTRGLWLLFACIAGLAAHARGDVQSTDERALKVAFPEADSIGKELIALTADERVAISKKLELQDAPRIFKYWVAKQHGSVIGYAVIDDARGKEQPITYLVSVDARLVIRSVEILAYRESRGGEVRQSEWRAQFKDKSCANPLRVGADIRNIAGATISCRSLTDGVRKQMACFATLIKPADASRPGAEGARAEESGGDRTRHDAHSIGSASERSKALASGARALVDRTQLVMGTTLTIRAYAPSDAAGSTAIDAAFAEVARLEEILSTWRDTSEVSRLNRDAGGPWQRASPELVELCALSVEHSARTGGAFDVSAGPLIELWKQAVHANAAPAEGDLLRALDRTGFTGILIDRPRGMVRLAKPGMALDFGGIGKGFALDRAARLLEERNIHSALLDFGGQLLALDAPPNEAAWIADVRDPAEPQHTLTRVRLVRASISSSADYERGMKLGDKLVSHIVDPHTGRPVEGMRGSSIVSARAVDADALSTATYVLGFDAAVRYAEEHGVAALIVAADGRSARTQGFRALELDGGTSR